MTNYIIEETLGQRIKAQRIRMGWTQERLADEMCVPKSTISAYENDRVDIKSSVIVELSIKLNTTPNYLLGIEEDPHIGDFVSRIMRITDTKIQEMLFIQVEALADNFEKFIKP